MSEPGGSGLGRSLRWPLSVAFLAAALAVLFFQWRDELSFRSSLLIEIPLLAFAAAVLPGGASPIRKRSCRFDLVATLALLLIGAGMRIWALADYPPPGGQLWEEAQMGATAATSLAHDRLDHSFPFADLIAEVGLFTGRPSLSALRRPFLFLGVLAVPIFYLAARMFLRSAPAALGAGLLFATSPMLAGASRVALESFSPVATQCLALAATAWACRARHPRAVALAGLCSALLLLEYDSFRIVPVLHALLLATALPWRPRQLLDRNPAPRNVAILGLAGIFAVLAAAPVVLADPAWIGEAVLRHQAELQPQHQQLGAWAAAREDLGKVASMVRFVFWGGGGNDVLPESMGIASFENGILGLLALLFCLTRLSRDHRCLFVVVAIALIVIGSGVLVVNPSRYRLMPMLPYWLLAIGLGAERLHDAGRRRWPHDVRAHVAGILIAAVFLLPAAAGVARFRAAVHDPRVRLEFADSNLDLAREIARIQQRQPGARIVVLGDRAHLTTDNDYSWLYDPATVEVANDIDEITPPAWTIAHEADSTVTSEPPLGADCTEQPTPLRQQVLRTCHHPANENKHF